MNVHQQMYNHAFINWNLMFVQDLNLSSLSAELHMDYSEGLALIQQNYKNSTMHLYTFSCSTVSLNIYTYSIKTTASTQ